MAKPGQVLVTDGVRESTHGGGSEFRRIGQVALKGFTRPVPLHQALAVS